MYSYWEDLHANGKKTEAVLQIVTSGGCHESKAKIKQNLSTCNSIKTGDGDLVCHLGLLISCFFFNLSVSLHYLWFYKCLKVIYESRAALTGRYFFTKCDFFCSF